MVKPEKKKYPKKPLGLLCVICYGYIHWQQDDRVYQPLTDKINLGDLALIGKCGHFGHTKCMALEITKSHKCPTCRAPVGEVFYFITPKPHTIGQFCCAKSEIFIIYITNLSKSRFVHSSQTSFLSNFCLFWPYQFWS